MNALFCLVCFPLCLPSENLPTYNKKYLQNTAKHPLKYPKNTPNAPPKYTPKHPTKTH